MKTITLTALALHACAALRLEGDVTPDAALEWWRGPRAQSAAIIELVVALKQPADGVAALKSKLMEVSDPGHPRYGQHLSNTAIHDLVAPSPAAASMVHSHFAHHKLVPLTPNGDLFSVSMPVAEAEAALGCEYYEYRHVDGATVIRTPSYGLPDTVAPFVDFVAPTVRLPSPSLHPKPSADSNGLFNTPKSLRALYSVGDAAGKAANNKQAVTGFLGQHFSPKDLQKFYKMFYPSMMNTTMAFKGDDKEGGFSGVEAMLDAEYITTLGSNIASEFWGFTGRAPHNPSNEPFLKWLGAVSNSMRPPP